MTEQAILEAVQEIFRDNFDDDTLEITRATCADDIEDWDSLEQINLLTAIEKKFNIKFKLADVRNLKTLATCWTWLPAWWVKMNHYTLAEMTPGLSESFTVTVTEEMMARFEAITGDVSPSTWMPNTPKSAATPAAWYTACWVPAFLHPGGRLPAGRTLPAARRGVQVRRAGFHWGYFDHYRHRGKRE